MTTQHQTIQPLKKRVEKTANSMKLAEYVRKHNYDHGKMGNILGVAGGSVGPWLRKGYCPEWCDKMIGLLMDKEMAKNSGQAVYIVNVPANKRDLFQTFCQGLGAVARDLD